MSILIVGVSAPRGCGRHLMEEAGAQINTRCVTVDEIQAPSDLRLASSANDGAGAGAGSVVRVEDRAGRISEYELVERTETAARERVTLGSPVGQALLGARPGDHIPITFGNGRRRRVRVLDVAAAA